MGFLDRLTCKTAATAATNAANTQFDFAGQASALLDPFQGIGQQGLNMSGFLTDPNQQLDFLQNNPIFQASLDNANGVTSRMSAAGGRLSSGDTLQSLSNNFLSTAYPMIQDQKNSIGNLLNYGMNTASNQGNLLTGQGAVLAGGIVGAENARGAGYQNIMDGVLNGAAHFFSPGGAQGAQGAQQIFSDPRLKDNVVKIDERNGFNIYRWTWNSAAALLGLHGSDVGVMADEVNQRIPNAVSLDRGYLKVDYSMLGVSL
jgi:hypothetical protein